MCVAAGRGLAELPGRRPAEETAKLEAFYDSGALRTLVAQIRRIVVATLGEGPAKCNSRVSRMLRAELLRARLEAAQLPMGC